MKKEAKPLTDKQKLNRYKFLQNMLVNMLERVQKDRFHEPNSDWHEYCNGCGGGRSSVIGHQFLRIRGVPQ